MGGLGHMGVKIAHAMGAEVTVLSQTLSKREDGLRLGADHYYATNDAAHALVTAYLQSETGSEQERQCLEALRTAGVEMAPHVGEAAEREALLKGQHRNLTRQAQAKGFG